MSPLAPLAIENAACSAPEGVVDRPGPLAPRRKRRDLTPMWGARRFSRRPHLGWLTLAALVGCTHAAGTDLLRTQAPAGQVPSAGLPHRELGLVQALRGAAQAVDPAVRTRLLRQFGRTVVHSHDFGAPAPQPAGRAPTGAIPALQFRVQRPERLDELAALAAARESGEQWVVVEIRWGWSPAQYGSAVADVVRRGRPHKLIAGNEVDIRGGRGFNFRVEGDAAARTAAYFEFYAAAAAAVPGVEVVPAGIASANSRDGRRFLSALLAQFRGRGLPFPSVLPVHFHEQPLELPEALDWLRQQFAQHGYADTEVVLTELGDLRGIPLGAALDPESHAYALAALMATSYGLGVRALVYEATSFADPVLRVSYPGLLDLHGRPRPAYQAFCTMQDLLPPGASRRLQLQARRGLARLDVHPPHAPDVTVWFAPVDPATVAAGALPPPVVAVPVPAGATVLDPLGRPLHRLPLGRPRTVEVVTKFGEPGSVVMLVHPATHPPAR